MRDTVCSSFAACLVSMFCMGFTTFVFAQAPDLAALRVNPINQAAGPEDASAEEGDSFLSVRVSEYLTVDLLASNAPLTDILNQLAVQSSQNIVPAAGVEGPITASIAGVPFDEALEAILHANSFGYVKRGDFYFVYTADQMRVVSQTESRLDTRVVRLNYLLAADAIRFAEPLLSDRGRIVATQDNAPETASESGSFGDTESIADPVYDPELNRYAMGNAVVVYDEPSFIAEVESLLLALDTKPAQVLIEATVLQTQLNEANAFGVDFAFLPDVQFTELFNFPSTFEPFDFQREPQIPEDQLVAASQPANDSFAVASPGNTGQGDATVRAGIIIDDDIGIFIRALDEVSDVSLLANPKVMALNRQRARVFVGARIGYLETTVADGVVIQNVEFVNEGIELDFRPFIQDDNAVRLELSPRLSDVNIRTVQGPEIPTEVPDQALQTVSTHVTVPKGTTAVLGGLFREDSTLTRRQTPILGDLPVVGGAFRGHDDSTRRNEIIFLIKPTIMSEAVLARTGQEAEAQVERVRAGSREGLLFWSKVQQSARLNVQAEQLAAEGHIEKAMWAIRRSLELHPVQPEAIRIREQLINEPQWWPNESLLDRISKAHVDALLDRYSREQASGQDAADLAGRAAQPEQFLPEGGSGANEPSPYALIPILPNSTSEQQEGQEGPPEPTGEAGEASSGEEAAPAIDIPEIPEIPSLPSGF
ncbi:MAG: hypothetical protein AAGB34_06440 [Planctomycetota bacterium]